MDDLVAFLRAQWDAEERLALDWQRHKQALTDQYMNDPNRKNVQVRREPVTDARVSEYAYRDRFDPARVLADLAMKRRILDEHAIVHRGIGWLEDGDEEHAEIPVCGSCVPKHSWYGRRADVPEGPCRTVRLLGEPYEGEDGYKQEWKPV